jgi:carboxymethylenebutenolidase
MHESSQRQELDSLLPIPGSNSRRGFLTTTLPAGFALAVQPVMSQTMITTPADGLTAGEVKIKTADGEMVAYRAMPAKGKNFPCVLVVEEIFGVHEHIKDICRRFAKLGYLAIAPELFARYGDPSKITDMQALMRDVIAKTPDSTVLTDLDATVAYMKANHGNTKKLAVTGFCWGGRITWLYAAHNPQVKAGAAWYGRLVGQPSVLQPTHPVDIASKLKTPVLGLYGEKDGGIPLESVETMRAALKAAGNASDIVVFKDAPHGFHADYRPSYRATDAKEAFAKLLAWFKQHGVA